MQKREARVQPVPVRTRATLHYGGPGGGGGVAITSRMFESLGHPVYRLYWGSMMGQMGAMNMQMVAQSWFMYQLTGSAALLGATAVASGVPMLLFSLYGGIIADQVQKKHVLLGGQTAFTLIALGIALLITLDLITWKHLIIASVLQGIVMSLMMPSRQAIIPEIVGEEGLTNAVALNAAGMNLNRLLAPAVAGVLIAALGVEAVYYAMTTLSLMAVLLVIALPRTGDMAIRGGGGLAQLTQAFRYIKESAVLPGLLLLTLLSVLFSMPYMNLLPIFTQDVIPLDPAELTWMTRIPLIGGWLAPLPDLLGESSFRLGVLMTISGLGALVGSLIVAAMAEKKRGLLYLLSTVITGVGLVGFAASPWYFLSLALIIPVGLGQAIRMALSNVLVQAHTEDAYRGRVMSVYMMEFGLTNFGVFGVAVLAEAIGVQWAIGGTAAMLLLLGLFYLAFVPQLRRLD